MISRVKKIQKRVIERGTSSLKVSISGENPLPLHGNGKFAAAISTLPENILEEHLKKMFEDYRCLDGVPFRNEKGKSDQTDVQNTMRAKEACIIAHAIPAF
jgi:hypothetical protein